MRELTDSTTTRDESDVYDHDDHRALHRAARRHYGRIEAIDNTLGWLVVVCAITCLITTDALAMIALTIVVLALTTWMVVSTAARRRGAPADELDLARAALVDYGDLLEQRHPGIDERRKYDDPEYTRRCARLDALEAASPWWQRN